MNLLFQSFTGNHRSVARVLGRRYFAASTEEYAKRNYANNVSEYNSVVGSLTAQRRHFLLRDVYDDMMLDGVQPTRDVFHSLIVGTMKGVRLQDGFYFKDQMKTTGLLPDVNLYNILISLCGKCKNSDHAVQILEEMKKSEVKPNAQTFVCLLNACAAAGRLDRVYAIVRDMTAAGVGLNKFCYAGLITAHKNKTPVADDFAAKVIEFVERSKDSLAVDSTGTTAENVMMGVSEEEMYNIPTAEYVYRRGGFVNRQLMIYHVALHACADLKNVEVMETLLEMLKNNGNTPDVFTVMQVMRCYLHSGDIDRGLKTFEDYMSSGKPPIVELYVTLVEGAMVGHTPKGMQLAQDTLVNMNSRDFFLSPKMGSDLLLLASGEKTGGYTTANYIWDLMQARNFIPSPPAVEAYYKGLKEREIPEDDPRLLLVSKTYDNLRQRSGPGPRPNPHVVYINSSLIDIFNLKHLNIQHCFLSFGLFFSSEYPQHKKKKSKMSGAKGKDSKSPQVYVGSIDQGTSSTRFLIYDHSARIVGSHQVEFTQFYPEAGWVEHDPMEILESVRTCIAKAVEKATKDGHDVHKGLKAIGLTNQRETTMLWSKTTGRPLHNAIVWMDVRTSAICRKLEKDLPGGRTHFVETCGLPINPYFSATKLLWLMENVDKVKEAVKAGDALFGTIDSWLIWNLTGGLNGGLHVTDVSNASRTMLMNLKTLDWDQPTLKTLGIVPGILPKIVSNSEVIGKICSGWTVSDVPISGCLGDQHAAMLGQACRRGEAKSTYGTGAFILLNTGEEITQSKHGLLTTLAFKLGPKAQTNYALEGSIAIAGAAVQWLRDSLGVIKTASEIEGLASEVESTGGVYFVPAFNGLFAPWWRDDARGVCIGITRFTGKAHIARAVLESMCFQVKDVLDSMHKDAGEKGEVKNDNGEFVLRVDGGATVNNLLMQIQADLLGSPVVRPADIETTALGAAYAAGLAVGVWTEDDIFAEKVESATIFNPILDEKSRKKKLDSWCKAVSRTFDLADLSL